MTFFGLNIRATFQTVSSNSIYLKGLFHNSIYLKRLFHKSIYLKGLFHNSIYLKGLFHNSIHSQFQVTLLQEESVRLTILSTK